MATYKRKGGQTDRGRVHQVGWKRNGEGKLIQARFNVGSDDAEADRRLATIQTLYGDKQEWDSLSLKIAKQVEKGQQLKLWSPSNQGLVTPIEYAEIVATIQAQVADPSLLEANPEKMRQATVDATEYIDQRLSELASELSSRGLFALAGRSVPDKLSSHSFKEAFAEYRKDRIENYSGKPSCSIRVEKELDKIIEFFQADIPLTSFGIEQTRAFVNHWRKRPKTKRSAVAAETYCSNLIGEFFKCLRWIGSTERFNWNCPDLSAVDRAIRTTSIRNVPVEKHFQPESLREIFRTAQPMTQLILALGLNTGSGAAELGRMRVNEFFFKREHPLAKIIKMQGVIGNWYVGHREKQRSHSEAQLWPWLVPLVQQQIVICEQYGWEVLFTVDGEPLYRDAELYESIGLHMKRTSKPESRFANRIERAIAFAHSQGRIDACQILSFGKLRKTLPNWLTMNAHEDLGSLLLSHGTQDKELSAYANRPWRRLHEAIMAGEDEWRLI